MKYFKLVRKGFCDIQKPRANKYKVISSKVNIPVPKMPELDTKRHPFGIAKKAPKPGEYYELEPINSKGMMMEMGMNNFYERDPISAYYSVKVKDILYHVFNASRVPMGQMCAKIAFIIQGKSSPHYRSNKVEYKDKCIILNAKHTWLTGKKTDQKLYRWHTGFPGGLKSIRAKDYMEEDPKEMLLSSIKGMLPKNKMRKLYLSKVVIYSEAEHDLTNLNLPHFGAIKPIDYNSLLGIGEIKPETHTIIDSTIDIEKHFPDLKDIPRHPDFGKPDFLKTPPKTRINTLKASKLEQYKRAFIRNKHKYIRSMNYLYI